MTHIDVMQVVFAAVGVSMLPETMMQRRFVAALLISTYWIVEIMK